MKRALITGIAGQDGSYLCGLLLSKGYAVHGMDLNVVIDHPDKYLGRLHPVLDQIQLHATSMENFANVLKVVDQVRPDECYHLAAQSFIIQSSENEFSTVSTNIGGTHHMLAALVGKGPPLPVLFCRIK